MKDDKGKVILSLLAGATAGIVAGLLLAPETGEEARTGLRQSARKLGDDLGKLLKGSLDKLQGHTAPLDEATAQAKAAADGLLDQLSKTPSASRPAKTSALKGQNISTAHDPHEASADYDGFGEDIRHRPMK